MMSMSTKGAQEGRRGACSVATMRSLPSFLFFLLTSGIPGGSSGALLASPLTMYTDADTDRRMKGRLDVTAHCDSNEYIPYQSPPRALATSTT